MAMVFHGLRFADIAAATGVNVKTVQRWVYEGRVPRARTRLRVARLLEEDAVRLWPGMQPDAWTPDLVQLYPQLDDVPANLWMRLARNATSRIDISGTLGLDQALTKLLADRAQAGVDVRILLEGQNNELSVGGAQVRRGANGCSFAIFRCDLSMLVWLRCNAPELDHLSPVLRLARAEDSGVFDAYAYVFERLWDDAEGSESAGLAK